MENNVFSIFDRVIQLRGKVEEEERKTKEKLITAFKAFLEYVKIKMPKGICFGDQVSFKWYRIKDGQICRENGGVYFPVDVEKLTTEEGIQIFQILLKTLRNEEKDLRRKITKYKKIQSLLSSKKGGEKS